MNQEKNIIKIKNLSIGYGQTKILDNINLDICQGKLTALVGANGCGKSTLLKTVARILQPWTGAVYLQSDNIHKLPTKAVAKKLALLPQAPTAPEGLTVKELVAQGRFVHQNLFNHWSKADNNAVADAMRATDTLKFADRLLSSLSGGQRQRCWLAMILAQSTDVILLDEPTTFLDLKVQVDMMLLLQDICNSQGKTLLIVLHELNLAAAFADHMVMMYQGEIAHQGKPKAVMTTENIKQVFDLSAHVITDPISGLPICMPNLPENNKSS